LDESSPEFYSWNLLWWFYSYNHLWLCKYKSITWTIVILRHWGQSFEWSFDDPLLSWFGMVKNYYVDCHTFSLSEGNLLSTQLFVICCWYIFVDCHTFSLSR
jgi:hypothetical protein